MIRVGQRYGKVDLADSWDAIVIGSGIGGLATASLLARHAGKRVLVLERHYMPGGFTHVYRRHGYEWDVGVHYIGQVADPRTSTRRLFDHVTEGRLEWASMGEVYDRIVLGEKAYDYVAGPGPVAARMKDGSVLEERQPCMRGGARQPLTRAELEAKCAANLEFAGRPRGRGEAVSQFADRVMAAEGSFNAASLNRHLT